jgi:CDP-diacylglycerol--glycerol-3-phosphate 3-phosphatidyltransferase
MKINFKDIFTVSNLLSFLRLLLTFPIIALFQYYGQKGISEVIVLLLMFAAITDILDGYLARKFNQITELGKMIDPIADKVLMSAVLILFLLHNLLPLYYILLMISRDILILMGGIFIAKRVGKVLQSNYLGKITVVTVGIVILLRLIGFNHSDTTFNLLYFLSIGMIISSFLAYLFRAINILRTGNGNI